MTKAYLSVRAAAAFLGVSKSYLDHARVSGQPAIPFAKLGRRVVYDRADLEAFVDARKHISTSETLI
ncbi:MAG: helix-turn-helix domain-containing protein [Alphaproteobacteria bacterium]|nr:helix-turn-helix domain-containing protein [Alphaproteobacteria bacterium]